MTASTANRVGEFYRTRIPSSRPTMPKLTIAGKSIQGLDETQRRERLLYLTGVIEGIAFETVYFINELIDHGFYLEVVWNTFPSPEHMACVLDAWNQHSVHGLGVVHHTHQIKSCLFTAVYAETHGALQLHHEVLANRAQDTCIKTEVGSSPQSAEADSMVQEVPTEPLMLRCGEVPEPWILEKLSEWWSASVLNHQLHCYCEVCAPAYDRQRIPSLRRVYS